MSKRTKAKQKEYNFKRRIYISDSLKALRARYKAAVYTVYGPACACCGETEEAFLSVDHIEGGGNKHRREIRNHNIAAWLVKNGFPKGYQILCMNCNFAKGKLGKCPHAA